MKTAKFAVLLAVLWSGLALAAGALQLRVAGHEIINGSVKVIKKYVVKDYDDKNKEIAPSQIVPEIVTAVPPENSYLVKVSCILDVKGKNNEIDYKKNELVLVDNKGKQIKPYIYVKDHQAWFYAGDIKQTFGKEMRNEKREFLFIVVKTALKNAKIRFQGTDYPL
jgi:hypothetical protein